MFFHEGMLLLVHLSQEWLKLCGFVFCEARFFADELYEGFHV